VRSGAFAGVVAIGIAMTLGSALIHPFGDPRRRPVGSRETLLQGSDMPEQTRRVLVTKCADCHSDTTHWPLYSHTAPASWLVERDAARGREHLNLSHWLELSNDRRQVLGAEINQQTRMANMPPLQYRLVHWSARLSPSDIAALALLSPRQADNNFVLEAGDAVRGKALFERKCTGCHSLDSDHEGPHLRGVYGRKAGTSPGFDYSRAVRDSGVVWTGANLERWLRDSDAMLSDSKMGFSVPKTQDRADIIEFLRTQ
jgi:cytochrome c